MRKASVVKMFDGFDSDSDEEGAPPAKAMKVQKPVSPAAVAA